MAKVGDIIEIIYMEGEPQYTGKTGRVRSVSPDPWGDTQIWIEGCGCALYEGKDSYRVIG